MSNNILHFDRDKHEYRDSRGVLVPSVTQIIAKAGLCDFSFVEEEIRNAAMQRGTSVHWMLQLHDEGKLNPRNLPVRLRPYRKAWAAWLKASGFVACAIEAQFISHYGFAGTIDRYGGFPPTNLFPRGSMAIVDIKTGDVSNWVRYQLAAYTIRIHPHPTMARTIRRIALAVRADGTYRVKEFPASSWDVDFSTFMEAKRKIDDGHVDHERSRD